MELLCSESAARVYLARWALRLKAKAEDEDLHETDERLVTSWSFVQAFSPQRPIVCRLLLALPASVLLWVGGLIARVLLSFTSAREITDGNVNFSFAVRGRGGKTLFVKQAREYLKWQPQMSLERERMEREVRYFRDASAALGDDGRAAARFLPVIHDFDPLHSVLVMDFLDGHTVLFEQLFTTPWIARAAAEGLGEYIGRVAARTLSPAAAADDDGDSGGGSGGYSGGGSGGCTSRAAAAAFAVSYWNPTLRAIQEEHVYTICFRESAKGRALADDPAVMAEVGELKAKYLGYSFDAYDR